MNPDALYSSGKIRVAADLAAAQAALAAVGQPTRAVRCNAAGTLTVTGADGVGGQAMPFGAGERQDVQIVAITAAGAVFPVTIFW